MNLKMRREMESMGTRSKIDRTIKFWGKMLLITLLVGGIVFLLAIVCGVVGGGDVANYAPRVGAYSGLYDRQANQYPGEGAEYAPTVTLEDVGNTLTEMSEGYAQGTEDNKETIKSGVGEYGKPAADLIGSLFTWIPIMIFIGFIIIGFWNDGVKGAILGAAIGGIIGYSVFNIWAQLYKGHVVPMVGVMIAGAWMGMHGIKGLIFAFGATIGVTFWVMFQPDLWNPINILHMYGASDWYEVWDLIGKGTMPKFGMPGVGS